MPDIGLSPQQLAVLCALSSGATTLAAADEAGVHRNTIANWRRNLLPFQRALAGAQYDRALFFREKIEAEVDLAIQTLHDLLLDPKTPPSVRLKAALAVLSTAATPPEPKKQIELLMETVVMEPPPQPSAPPVAKDAQPAPQPPPPSVHKPAQATPVTAPQPVHKPAQATPVTTPQPVHKPAQATPVTTPQPVPNPAPPQPPYRRESLKVGRNDTCPCGSGKKYKRCCIELACAA